MFIYYANLLDLQLTFNNVNNKIYALINEYGIQIKSDKYKLREMLSKLFNSIFCFIKSLKNIIFFFSDFK